MNKESFLDTIKQQYSDEIHAAYVECEHGGGHKIDLPELSKRLQKLMASAKVEGLPGAEFEDLVRATLPDIAEKVELRPVRKAA
jgi:hypothetical protein